MFTLVKSVAIIALLAVFAAAAIEVAMASNTGFVASTISNNERLNVQFEAAALLVEEFRDKNQRLPPNTEFHGTIYPFDIENPFDMKNEIAALQKAGLEAFGPPPPSDQQPYLLVDWQYDVPMLWASWTRTSNAFTDPARFYVFGSSKADTLLFGAGALISLLAAAFLSQWGLTSRSTRP
jgi:hypothetical protein